MAFRLDRNELAPPRRLDGGRVVFDATLTRSGVFLYRDPTRPGGVRREWRDPKEVFDAKSMASAEYMPVANDHPPVMVTAQNAKQYTVGQVGDEIRRVPGQKHDHLAARFVVNDATTLADMEAGKAQTSCGYECELDETPGTTPDGERYDVRQHTIRYNHLAIVMHGRAETSGVRMDGRDVEIAIDNPPASASEKTRADGAQQGSTMDELKKALADLAEQTRRADAAERARDDAQKRADAADAKAKELEREVTAANSATATEKKRADEAEKKATDADKARTDAAENFDARVDARADLIARAAQALGRNDKGEVLALDGRSTINLRAMKDREIRCLVVKKLDGIEIPATRSDDTVTYAYELAVQRDDAAAGALGAARQTIVFGRDARSDANGDPEKAAAAEARKQLNNAWKIDSTKEGK